MRFVVTQSEHDRESFWLYLTGPDCNGHVSPRYWQWYGGRWVCLSSFPIANMLHEDYAKGWRNNHTSVSRVQSVSHLEFLMTTGKDLYQSVKDLDIRYCSGGKPFRKLKPIQNYLGSFTVTKRKHKHTKLKNTTEV